MSPDCLYLDLCCINFQWPRRRKRHMDWKWWLHWKFEYATLCSFLLFHNVNSDNSGIWRYKYRVNTWKSVLYAVITHWYYLFFLCLWFFNNINSAYGLMFLWKPRTSRHSQQNIQRLSFTTRLILLTDDSNRKWWPKTYYRANGIFRWFTIQIKNSNNNVSI